MYKCMSMSDDGQKGQTIFCKALHRTLKWFDGVIRNRNSKVRQYNNDTEKGKRTNNHLQNTT
jgi:hypothetical protein